jgi:hypothetical protein
MKGSSGNGVAGISATVGRDTFVARDAASDPSASPDNHERILQRAEQLLAISAILQRHRRPGPCE